jgi:tRNA(fMet)-specific endonuclease VapC
MKLLDTSALIDIDRGNVDDKVAKLDDQGRHALSMVTVTEMQLGVNIQYDPDTDDHRRAMEQLTRLFARFELFPITRSVASAGAAIIAQLREEGRPVDDLHDVYVAATARVEQLPVLTANVDHFEPIDGVTVVDWGTF